ncbi:hypothetical protein [Mycobacterium sp. IDR2000157661]|uniref:hypothetical protein n=1 Tax=Mycobacterium sp. IDR2000157661 TaxID=2867005 RepID=UPI001EEA008F|nr:hypothetical protein [Mycobacterium sp. IDR2000157661]ULE33955.1 hypothetical protein K3G64_04490 [Mycobacterium sp. IDR2000157661]
MADQLLFSLSNFMLTVMVARESTAAEFGAFSLAYVVFLVVQGGARGLVAETFSVSHSTSSESDWRDAAKNGAGSAATMGVIVGVAISLGGWLVGGSFGQAVCALGLLLPGLLLQDFMRYAALAARRPRAAALNDCIQLLFQSVGIAFLVLGGDTAVWQILAAWGLSAWIAGAFSASHLRVRPNLCGMRRWFDRQGVLPRRLAADNLITQLGQHSGSLALAAVAPISAVGAFNGGTTLFRPASVFSMAVKSAVVPELVRSARRSISRFQREILLTAGLLAALSIVWSAVVLALPDSVGVAVLGDTWETAEPLLPYLAIAQIVSSCTIAPMVGLRSLADGSRTVRARIYTTAIFVGSQVAGALINGAIGTVVALAISSPISASIWWAYYRRAIVTATSERESKRIAEL